MDIHTLSILSAHIAVCVHQAVISTEQPALNSTFFFQRLSIQLIFKYFSFGENGAGRACSRKCTNSCMTLPHLLRFLACLLCNIYGVQTEYATIYCGLEGFCTKCVRGLMTINSTFSVSADINSLFFVLAVTTQRDLQNSFSIFLFSFNFYIFNHSESLCLQS